MSTDYKRFMDESGISNYCKNICKGKCCIGHCQDFRFCDNELCLSFTCSKVRKELNLSQEEIEYCKRIKIETRARYRKLLNTRNPYFLNVRRLGGVTCQR